MTPTERGAEMLTVSGLCMCNRCTSRTTDIYRMVGRCWNCGTEPILMLFRAGDKKAELDCPVCGNHWSVHPQRLAADDEFPEALLADERRQCNENAGIGQAWYEAAAELAAALQSVVAFAGNGPERAMCKKALDRFAVLAGYVSEVTDVVSEAEHPCRICGRRFRFVNVLELHESRHVGEVADGE